MVFLPVYAATSQMFGPVDVIRTVLNHIILWLALIAGALSSWCDWRVRRAGGGGILLRFPCHRVEMESTTGNTQQQVGPQ